MSQRNTLMVAMDEAIRVVEDTATPGVPLSRVEKIGSWRVSLTPPRTKRVYREEGKQAELLWQVLVFSQGSLQQ